MRWWLAGLVALVAWSPSVASAQSSDSASAKPERQSGPSGVLHEYVDPDTLQIDAPAPEPGASRRRGEEGDESAASRPPSRRSSQSGAPPELTLNPGPGDVVRGPGGPLDGEVGSSPYGPASRRSGSTPLDRKTNRVSDLEYHATFDPSLFPYKRKAAQNRVRRGGGGQYGMSLDSGRFERLSTRGSARPGEDTFWGTFLIRAKAGRLHPIPTPAPTTRMLEIQTEPRVDLQVLRDEADNYYLKIDGHDGRVRVNARVAAPRYYFRGRFDAETTWAEFPDAPMASLPTSVARTARGVLEAIGISRATPPAKTMEKLIYHFRNFEARELSDDLGDVDLYETIATRQVGVCRHRSLAFVITARALGIPARYVYNEAHAFVEVRWPNRGWRRIDLGGIARDISYDGSRRDRLHDAGRRDSFPQPPEYREEMREMRERRGGPTDSGNSNRESASSNDSNANRPDAPDSPGDSSRSASTNTPGASSPGESSNGGTGTPSELKMNVPRGAEGANTGTSGRGENRDADVERRSGGERSGSSRRENGGRSRKTPTRLGLRASRQSVLRGKGLKIDGVLTTTGGEPLSNQTVTLYLGRVGSRSPEHMTKLTTVETDRSGRFEAQVSIPRSTGIGRWSLIAIFDGSERYAGSRSD